MKTCRKCGIEKPIETGFYKNKRSKDGYQHQCKQCHLYHVNRANHEFVQTITLEPKINLKTASEASDYILSQGVEIIAGKVYNIYFCGCVLENSQDPNIMSYFPEKHNRNRSCPDHRPSALLSKFKLCRCGQMYFSSRAQASLKCKCCYNIKDNNKNYGKKRLSNKFKNGRDADFSRWDCSRREICLDWFDGYECTPCLDCGSYTQKTLDIGEYLYQRGENSASEFSYTRREMF